MEQLSTQQEVSYSDVMALGFKEEPQKDKVYYNDFGYEYVIISKRIAKSIVVYWTKNERTLEAVRLSKDEHNVLGRMPIVNIEHLKTLITFYNGK